MRVGLHYLGWRVGATHAETQTTDRERACLVRHAKGRSRLVEFGVWHGVTTSCLRAAMDPAGELSAVDPYPASWLGFSVQEQIAHGEVDRARGGRIRWIKATGKDAAAGHLTVEFVFIDGDHSEEGLLGDWNAWSALVEPGRVVALHDSHSTPERPIDDAGSVKVTTEVILRVPRFQFVEVVDSLTVVRRRSDV